MTLTDQLAGLPGLSLTAYASARRAAYAWTAGDGQHRADTADLHGAGPVVLVGGFCTTDRVLGPMRDWLRHLGYQVLTHTLNSGMACGTSSVEAVRATVRRAAQLDEQGCGVHVVGYSRGGQFARILATDAGAGIRSLVTVGSPFELYRIGPTAMLPALAVLAAGSLGVPNLATPSCLFGSCCAEYRRRLRASVPVPFTSIYSRQDRLVPSAASVDGCARNVEVGGSHLDLVESGPAQLAVARALAGHP